MGSYCYGLSLALDSSGNPHIGYIDANDWGHVKYASEVLPYDVAIGAYCNNEAANVSVSITKDGASTGFSTSKTFTGLTGTHTFTVPSSDANGHPFKQWNTGSTSTTITVTSGGTYTAYYEVPPYDVAIGAYCNNEAANVSVGITKDGAPTGFTLLKPLQV